MAEINKPDYSQVWASGGAIVAPSDLKIQTGWTAEVPPFQWENWSQNRQDQAIAHVLQHGISVWDNATEYQAGKSYVQGSNGNVYRCLITNIATNPVGDVSGTWRLAWLESNTPLGPVVATAAQSRAFTDNTVFISPLQLANAFTGSNSSLNPTGFMKYPNSVIEQWGTTTTIAAGTSLVVTYPTPFTSAVWNIQATLISTGASAGVVSVGVQSIDNNSFRFDNRNAGSISASIYWTARGI